MVLRLLSLLVFLNKPLSTLDNLLVLFVNFIRVFLLFLIMNNNGCTCRLLIQILEIKIGYLLLRILLFNLKMLETVVIVLACLQIVAADLI